MKKPWTATRTFRSDPKPRLARRLPRFGGRWLCVALLSLISGSSNVSGSEIVRSLGKDGVIELRSRASGKSKQGATRGQRTLPSAALATQFEPFILEAARVYHLPAALVRAVVAIESGFDPRAVSPVGAQGLMQLMPATAQRMMVTDILDPRQNILGGTRYLRVLANTFNGNIQLTLAAYNAGEGAVTRYAGIPPYAETQDYVVRVLAAYQRYQEL